MKEKLIIKNFGPITSVELELGRFNILIGEQATGKSTIAKVLAMCRYFSYINDNSIYPPFEPFKNGLDSWGLTEFLKKDSFIHYNCQDYDFEVRYDEAQSGNILNNEMVQHTIFRNQLIPLSNKFKNLKESLINIWNNNSNDLLDGRIPTSFYLNDVKNVMDNPFYLPTERGLQSIFSLGKTGIKNLAGFLFRYFSKVDGIQRTFNKETEIEALGLYYVNRNGIGYIRKKSETDFSLLANAASGYQSTIPIILIMKYYENRKRKKTFIIEEPELNLFPIAQYELMKYLVQKNVEGKNSLLIATHSPYILASINNLLLAKKYGNDKVAGVIDKKYWLNIDDVSAYMLLQKEGAEGIEAEDIIDKESGQIKAEKIDGASQIIGNEYEKIMDIAYS